MSDRLQNGIYFRAHERPAPCWRLVLLDARPGAHAAQIADALTRLTALLASLSAGQPPELAGQDSEQQTRSQEQFGSLVGMLAYGRTLFDTTRHDPPLTTAPRPDYLAYLPSESGGYPALKWQRPGTANDGEADFAFQLTADNEAAVSCAAVEIDALIRAEPLPLRLVASFAGFGRRDRRGWLGFHDGVNNMVGEQRSEALEAAPDPGWMAGGTYMAFLRLAVDLDVWRRLPRHQQELIVGRDKLSGTALSGTRRDASGAAHPVVAARAGHDQSDADDQADWVDPPQVPDALVEVSHIHRANQNRASPSAPGALRMFRQGYDYLEALGPQGPVLGLNFVSFQRDLSSFAQVMHLPGWLGDVNFGGPTDPAPGDPPNVQLLRLQAGGLYAVPPRAVPFPGAVLFD